MATTKSAEESKQFLSTIISGTHPSKTTEVYGNYSDNYEQAMTDVLYFGSKTLIEQFEKLNVPKEAKILDVCAGTGAVGRELVERGYSDLHAIDGSEGMLAKAKAEGNYKSYTHLLFTADTKLPYADGEFDCVLLAGVFAPGHLPVVALHEVCRVTKVGGIVAWINCDPKHYEDKDEQYADGGFYKVLDEIKSKGFWKEHEGFPVRVPYIEYSEGFVMVFDVTGK